MNRFRDPFERLRFVVEIVMACCLGGGLGVLAVVFVQWWRS